MLSNCYSYIEKRNDEKEQHQRLHCGNGVFSLCGDGYRPSCVDIVGALRRVALQHGAATKLTITSSPISIPTEQEDGDKKAVHQKLIRSSSEAHCLLTPVIIGSERRCHNSL